MTERFRKQLARSASADAPLLACGVVGGDPYLEALPELLGALVRGGADVVEVINPTSDAAYHGTVIQRACQRALREPFALHELLEQIRRWRDEDPTTPLLLSSYYNQLLAPGLERACSAMVDAGVDAVSIVDLPWREAEHARGYIKDAGMLHIPVMAPTTPDARASEILASAKEGAVIWAGHVGGDVSDRAQALERLIDQCALGATTSVLASLHVSTPAEARAVAMACHGVLVASSVVWLVEGKGADLDERLTSFVESLRQALDA